MWYVHYNHNGTEGMYMLATLELAIQASCTLIERGMVVSEIEGVDGHMGMNAVEIKLACSELKAK